MTQTITGKIKHISAVKIISGRLKKQEFVVDYIDNSIIQPIVITITDIGGVNGHYEKIKMLNNFKVGDEVVVDFNILGREWNGPQGTKYFNSFDAWRVKLVTNKINI